MGEATSVRSPRKTSLLHLRAMKRLITAALDLKRWRVDPEAFPSIFSGYFMSATKRVGVVKSQDDRDTWSNGEHSFKGFTGAQLTFHGPPITHFFKLKNLH